MILFLVIALFGFCVSLAVHLSTFGNHPVLMSQSWPLHIGMFFVFVPMIIAQKRWNPAAGKRGRGSINQMFTQAPKWISRILGFFFAYTIVNFALFAIYSIPAEKAGAFANQDGRYVIRRHGQIVREISEEEYRYHEARVARGFSGHWMLFYGVSVVGLYDAMLRKRQAVASGVQDSATNAGISSRQRFLGRSPRLSLFTHSILARFAGGFGFLAAPVCMVLLFLPALHARSGWACCFVPIFFGSGIVGAVVGQTWLARAIAARCPSCGGRAFGTEQPRGKGGGWIYTCRDCGEVHTLR